MINNKNMKKVILLSIMLFFSVTISDAAYYNDDIPQGAGSYGYSSSSSYNYNSGSKIGNTYYAPSGTSYTRQGNQIYGSNGSSYTNYSGFVQSNSTRPQSYQINNNLIQPLN